ncbi:MAG: tetratricopeptide repeat protein [Candidatus Eisenbacteria bacterium]|uniref:Tetratricopeptide repeat protein n=1 Tax=Eiseniibacteriota bacterium TaxID=2212470 RepID=A0A948RWT7_UNCEI|nr:tetratricopeptide repeat protein [Candidatus Eisenbacteria bacterium]
MRDERDYLAKVTFPKLRKLCRQRNVEFIDVDLRWGVTDEQKAEGKVLPICLAEIERCRPYFIGLIGERYGWVPEKIGADLIEEQGWLEGCGQKSVTELEILHGVLKNPAMASHAFFYFRDPRKSREIERRIRAERGYRPEPESSSLKLAALKEKIETSGLPVHRGYLNVEELDERVQRNLTRVINSLYPADARFDPLDQAAADHKAFAKRRLGFYIGREEYFAAIDAHIESESQPLVILGESGSGKSAFLANWAAKANENRNEQVFLLSHYIGSSPHSTDWATMLKRIMGEIKRLMGVAQDIPNDPAGLRAAFTNCLHKAAAKGRLILILDALNQLEDVDGAPDLIWLPPQIPANVRIILSTLPGRALDELERRHWPTLTIKGLDKDERRRFIRKFLRPYAKSLNPIQIDRIVEADQTRNPLFLRTLLEELRLFGKHEDLDGRIDYYLEAESAKRLYVKVLGRWEGDYEESCKGLVRQAMSCIWAARRGLSESELLDLLGPLQERRSGTSFFFGKFGFPKHKDMQTGTPLPAAYWAPLYLAAEESLILRSGLLDFAHDYLREAVGDVYLESDESRKAVHIRLADYFDNSEPGGRRIDELPWQLKSAREWKRLYGLLSDLDFFNAAWKTDPLEIKSHWAALESNSDFKMTVAYQPVLTDPARFRDFAWNVGRLFYDTGYLEQSLKLRDFNVTDSFQLKEYENMASALHNRASTLNSLGRREEAARSYEEAEKLYRKLEDSVGLAVSLNSQAVFFLEIGETEKAMNYLNEANSLYASIGDDLGQAQCMINQAEIHHQRGDLDKAIELFESAETLCRRHGDRLLLSTCAIGRASAYFDRGDRVEAFEQNRRAVPLARELGDKDRLISVLYTQGLIQLEQGKATEASGKFEEIELIGRDSGFIRGVIFGLLGKASVAEKLNDLKGALEYYREAESACRNTSSRDRLAEILSNQGLILQKLGEHLQSRKKYEESESISKQIDHRPNLATALRDQAIQLWKQGRLGEALAKSRESEELYNKMDHKQGMAISMDDQATILRDGGRVGEALTLMKSAEKLWRELDNKIGIAVCLGNQGLALQKLKDFDGAMKAHKEEEGIYREIDFLEGLQRSIGNQGVILETRGDLDGAMKCYKYQERIATQLRTMSEVMTSIGNQALIWDKRGNAGKALELLRQTETYFREHSELIDLQLALGNIGQILEEQGDSKGALERFREMEAICREAGHPEGLKKSLRCQADLYNDREDHEKALACAAELEKISAETNDDIALVSSLSRQAHCFKRMGDPGKALETLKQEENICRNLEHGAATADCLYRQALLMVSAGDPSAALATLAPRRELEIDPGNEDVTLTILRLEIAILLNQEGLDGAQAALGEYDGIIQNLDDAEARVWSLGIHSLIEQKRGKMDEAQRILKEQRRLLEEHGLKSDLLANITAQVNIALDRQQTREALALHLDHEQVAREIGNNDQLKEGLKMQICILMDLDELDKTWEKRIECEALCRESSDEDGLALCTLIKAATLEHRGEQAAAEAACREGLEGARCLPPERRDFIKGKLNEILRRVT